LIGEEIGPMQNLQNLNPGDLEKYIKGINFPASKQEVTSTLKSNGAPSEILTKVEGAAKNQFSNQGDLMSTLGGP
jgi:Protein of unknown function (DUF2795)